MGKRGYDPKEKQSSTLSNARVLELMFDYNFAVQGLSVPVQPKPTTRRAVSQAQRRFGECAHISSSGESVFLCGKHVETQEAVEDICIKLSNMLGIGEREALYKMTGIPELKPT